MKVLIRPSKLSGIVKIPPSKSYTHRALVLAALAKGTSIVSNILESEDIYKTINALKKLGVNITVKNKKATVTGVNGKFALPNPKLKINVGNSGTTYRFITALSMLADEKVQITGSKRLRKRPNKELIDALSQFKKNKIIEINSNKSSQYLSALLLVAPYSKNNIVIKTTGLSSAPYVEITLDLMRKFGARVTQKDNFYFISNKNKYVSRNIGIEGDYSQAAYFFAAEKVTNSKVLVKNLNQKSVQGDKYFLNILSKIKSKNNLNRELEFDMKNYPDIVPILAIVAAYGSGTTTIKNISHLRYKESDRLKAVANELSRMGIKVKEGKNYLKIKGGQLKGAEINTYSDHRIAMSFAIAALGAHGNTLINNAEVVNKSYPNFWNDLRKIGANISFLN